ncbi:hypothetical protein FRC02_012068 [Tulasnella sp. 418]|nr:hypothetical protein FRC02_012068 [Tulasnella sp. 418]
MHGQHTSGHTPETASQALMSSSEDRVPDDLDEDGFSIVLPVEAGCQRGFLNRQHLFPCRFREGFTTAPASRRLHKWIRHYPLSDSALNVAKQTPGLSHNKVDTICTTPGTDAWEAVYPEGSINPKGVIKGGFGFYLSGPKSFSCEDAHELIFSYGVYFEPGFDFNKGGKLPGLYGGETPGLAYGCSGGRKQDRGQCFSLRLMWRENGGNVIITVHRFGMANVKTIPQMERYTRICH